MANTDPDWFAAHGKRYLSAPTCSLQNGHEPA
jgi:hypothetical protein